MTQAGFSLLTPSRPGYGRTPLDVGRSSEQAAEAFIALLDCLNISTCSVIAVSGGGPTGISLAASFPQRIERLVLMAAVSRPEERIHEPSYKSQMAFYGPSHGNAVENAAADQHLVPACHGPADDGDLFHPRS